MLLFIPLFSLQVCAGLGSSSFPPAAESTLPSAARHRSLGLPLNSQANLQIHTSLERGRGSTPLTWATVEGKGIVLGKSRELQLLLTPRDRNRLTEVCCGLKSPGSVSLSLSPSSAAVADRYGHPARKKSRNGWRNISRGLWSIASHRAS